MPSDFILYLTISVMVHLMLAIVIRSLWPAAGVLRIDHSNPEKDVYRFDIENLDALSTKSRIVLKVDNDADLSQKKQTLL